MTLPIIAGGGVAKTMLAVTISLHPAAAHHDANHVKVKAGDTLSSISKHEFGHAGDWPAVWWANRHQVSNPSMIKVGQRLRLPGKHQVKPWLAKAAVAAIPAPAPAPAPAAAAPASSTVASSSAPAPVQSTSSYSGSGGFQSCVIAAESGGNPNAVNASSGAGGLYQFLPSTWRALGHSGLPQDASVAEQNQAFAQEYAQSGGSAWSAYDGC